MLVKYREELTRPLQEAMEFMRRVETQLSMLTNGPVRVFNPGTPFFFQHRNDMIPLFTAVFLNNQENNCLLFKFPKLSIG